MKILKVFFAVLFYAAISISCHSDSKTGNTGAAASDVTRMPGELSNETEHAVLAEETINTQNYTYVKVAKEDQKFWVAIPRQEVQVGNTYYFTESLLMEQFHSAELNRDFDQVFFVSNFYTEAGNPVGTTTTSIPDATEKATESGESVKVNLVPGAVSLSELLANAAKYAGKKVKITGKCVKFNSGIMGKNWLHIQDGSQGNPDLTVTTNGTVQVGAVVTLEGVITLNKDFGAGYKYDVIMEDAEIK